MLKVKTYLDRSQVHGIGLYAKELIYAGKEIWAFHPKVDIIFEPHEWQCLGDELAEPSYSQLRQLAYREDGKIYFSLDNAQFMNHSKETANVINRKENNTMVASREIKAGEELLCNYFEFCDSDDESLLFLSGL